MASRAATKGVSLLKRGWHEIPEIMCCLGMIGLGTCFVGIGYAVYDRDIHHRYRMEYTVVRDTDVKKNLLAKNVYN